jgi:P-type conjugative transfer protein TrbJ
VSRSIGVKKFLLQAMLVAGCATFSASSHAQWIVFDPTNFTQNMTTAVEAVVQTIDQYEQLRVQYEQYSAQLKQLKSLDGEQIQRNLRKALTDKQNVDRMLNLLREMHGTSQEVQGRLENRFNEQKLSGLSWQQYSAREDQRIRQGVQSAINRSKQDMALIEKVKTDYESVMDWQNKVGTTTGTHQAMQLLSTQMNKVVSQGAEMMKVHALNSLKQNEQEVDKAAADQRARDVRDADLAKRRQASSSTNTDLNRWKMTVP